MTPLLAAATKTRNSTESKRFKFVTSEVERERKEGGSWSGDRGILSIPPNTTQIAIGTRKPINQKDSAIECSASNAIFSDQQNLKNLKTKQNNISSMKDTLFINKKASLVHAYEHGSYLLDRLIITPKENG